MIVNYLVDKKYIPNDGSLKIIDGLSRKLDEKHSRITIYPDVHYKKGSRVVNGMIYSSDKYILPACLGVENCGYTVALISSKLSDEQICNSLAKYARNKAMCKRYAPQFVFEMFENYLTKDYKKKTELYKFLGYDDIKHLIKSAEKYLTEEIIDKATTSLGVLGSGNHFFEVHEIVESKNDFDLAVGDKVCVLHSDSILVGDYINLVFSNLSELDLFKGQPDLFYKRMLVREEQLRFFFRHRLSVKDVVDMIRLIYSQKDYRLINMNSRIGKILLIYHNLASIFGDMNRDIIISEWANLSGIEYKQLFSHPHDNISVEKYNNVYTIVQRNGVQNMQKDDFFFLPGAMGTPAYFFFNPKENRVFCSANHGTGRFDDKHIARSIYTKYETISELENKKIKLYKIGNGNIAEQNYKAFKDVDLIAKEMEKYGLGNVAAKTRPIAIVKG